MRARTCETGSAWRRRPRTLASRAVRSKASRARTEDGLPRDLAILCQSPHRTKEAKQATGECVLREGLRACQVASGLSAGTLVLQLM